jgi:hypothetical protein
MKSLRIYRPVRAELERRENREESESEEERMMTEKGRGLATRTFTKALLVTKST